MSNLERVCAKHVEQTAQPPYRLRDERHLWKNEIVGNTEMVQVEVTGETVQTKSNEQV